MMTFWGFTHKKNVTKTLKHMLQIEIGWLLFCIVFDYKIKSDFKSNGLISSINVVIKMPRKVIKKFQRRLVFSVTILISEEVQNNFWLVSNFIIKENDREEDPRVGSRINFKYQKLNIGFNMISKFKYCHLFYYSVIPNMSEFVCCLHNLLAISR